MEAKPQPDQSTEEAQIRAAFDIHSRIFFDFGKSVLT
jgi:hypothetical protein